MSAIPKHPRAHGPRARSAAARCAPPGRSPRGSRSRSSRSCAVAPARMPTCWNPEPTLPSSTTRPTTRVGAPTLSLITQLRWTTRVPSACTSGRGSPRSVRGLAALSPSTRWLDYGAGLGGLVRYTRATVGCESFGFDEGYGAEQMTGWDTVVESRRAGCIARLVRRRDRDRSDRARARSDRPLAPRVPCVGARRAGVSDDRQRGAAPARPLRAGRTPRFPTCTSASSSPRRSLGPSKRRGSRCCGRVRSDGLSDVIRYKVLKTAHVHRTNAVERVLPWRTLSQVVDRRHRVSAMPAGRRPR